jgi:hypothetical protein
MERGRGERPGEKRQGGLAVVKISLQAETLAGPVPSAWRLFVIRQS